MSTDDASSCADRGVARTWISDIADLQSTHAFGAAIAVVYV
jgi:hypothetical protein